MKRNISKCKWTVLKRGFLRKVAPWFYTIIFSLKPSGHYDLIPAVFTSTYPHIYSGSQKFGHTFLFKGMARCVQPFDWYCVQYITCIYSRTHCTISCVLCFSSLTLTNPLGASVSMKTWLQESSANRSEMNLTGVAFTSCRLTHTNTNQ